MQITLFQHFHWCFCEDILYLEHYNWTIPGSSQSGHFQAPVLKIKRDKCELNQQSLQSAPLIDKYIAGIQTRQTLVIDDNSPLLTPLMIEKSTLKAVFQQQNSQNLQKTELQKVKLLSAK